MRLYSVFFTFFTAVLMCGPVSAQEQNPSPPTASVDKQGSPAQDGAKLPVSVDRIRAALEQQPTRPLFNVPPSDLPMFRVDVQERNRIQELLATLDFKSGPTPAGGLHSAEQQRVMFPTTNNPLQQPYAAFSQSELLTVVVENLAGKYLVGKAVGAITSAERARALAAARDEVRRTIAEYCTAQPDAGAGIAICTNLIQ